MTTDEQISDQLDALAWERTGYERRLLGASEVGDKATAKAMTDRIDAVNARCDELRGKVAPSDDQARDKSAGATRERKAPAAQRRVRGES